MPTPLISLDIPEPTQFQDSLELSNQIKQNLMLASNSLNELFWQDKDIISLLNTRAIWIDKILSFAWKLFKLDEYNATLIAVGGYGCFRLHPYSDADILILIDTNLEALNVQIEKFIAFCWDCSIKLGASVRTSEESIHCAQEDLSIYTNLLNMRFVTGKEALFQQFAQSSRNANLWPFKAFFKEKCEQRRLRYERYQNTEYNLEPNIKESPGGLRDVDLILWFCNKRYATSNLTALIEHHDISQSEFELLSLAQKTLWHFRYGLHLVCQSPTEKLFFDHQAELAKRYAFNVKTLNEAISILMKPYYQNASIVRSITTLLCQHYQEECDNAANQPKTPLTSFCEKSQNFLNITRLAPLSSSELMQLFYLIAKHHLAGLSVVSTKKIKAQLEDIPSDYFNNAQTHKIFLEILSLPNHVATTLSLMHQLSVLSHYIPAFQAIHGQMQYDLTHLYTVDAHTLMLVHYLENFLTHSSFDKLEALSQCKTQINNFTLLYICALFHDIGKGQGGNHSHIGSHIVTQFCQQLAMNTQDIELIGWLVDKHLLMSLTAQHKDISDELVIQDFAKEVKTKERLSYLYLFTAADMLATNPTLWNQWRASLLYELYLACAHWMENQSNKVIDSINKSQKNKQDALAILQQLDELKDENALNRLWQNFNEDYFRVESCANIAWQTKAILQDAVLHKPFTMALRKHHNQIGINLFVYAPDNAKLFAAICSCLEKNYLTIVQARINHMGNNFSLQSFVALTDDNSLMSEYHLKQIQHTLNDLLTPIVDGLDYQIPIVTRHIPRLHQFGLEVKVALSTALDVNKSILEVHAPDFPGLLARLAEVFIHHDVIVHSAIINTLGSQVEDIFYITDKHTAKALAPKRSTDLKAGIEDVLGKYCR